MNPTIGMVDPSKYPDWKPGRSVAFKPGVPLPHDWKPGGNEEKVWGPYKPGVPLPHDWKPGTPFNALV